MAEWDRASIAHQQQQQQYHHHHHHLDETQQSWLLGPDDLNKKKNKYVDLGCVVCSRKALPWTLWSVMIAFFVIALPTIIAKYLPKHKPRPSPPDNYTLALHKALLFFNAQKSGRLPKNHGVSWRGNSGLQDGSTLSDVKGGLVEGYYDGGDNTKYHFPMSFAMTMLSWSVIEYEHKYRAIGEYDHTRDLFKWGTDYLLLTFNSFASKIDKIYSRVGGSRNGSSTTPDDHYCWERPENMDYPRPVQAAVSGPDLSGEMAAALAAASIVFRDDNSYSSKLVKGAATVFAFARDRGKRTPYSRGNLYIDPYYNSAGYFDEYMWAGRLQGLSRHYMWGAAWLYYATGNNSYVSLATNPGLPQNSKAFFMIPDLSVLSWDNKPPAAMLLLTRLRIFINPGYPYEDMLRSYQKVTSLTMCSYLQTYHVFNWTRGGLIQLNHGGGQPLQYVANAAFLASLYVDYMNATGVPGWYCGASFITLDVLRTFATSQIDYILGANPLNMSYVVGYGGWKWRDSRNPNPNTITGAMVGGPDRFDRFQDIRTNFSYTQPTMAGNAGLVAALVSLTASGGYGIDKNISSSTTVPPEPATTAAMEALKIHSQRIPLVYIPILLWPERLHKEPGSCGATRPGPANGAAATPL
ncbi:hypothetical protein ACSBR2_015119 [Camellia fascicularis]